MAEPPPDRSYRALFEVPSLGRILLGGTIARTAGAMAPVALVLFALAYYGSPLLAGSVTFTSIAPGLLVSPLAGALLDRHRRTTLVTLDYFVCAAAFALLAALALGDWLPVPAMLAIVALSSMTGIFSHTGLRSLFPVIVPQHLWERVNAADSNGYVAAMLLGPPAAGAMVQVLGGPAALLGIAALYTAGAWILRKVPEPKMPVASRGRLHLDALDGLRYTVRNPVLRALACTISTQNVGHGALTVIVPVVILQRLGGHASTVGFVFAAQGLTGMLGALVVGRWQTEGRERALIFWPLVAISLATALLLMPPSLPVVFLAFAVIGLMNGPMDVAMFTLRQRRTDPAWMGRAFAVSMALNYIGYPIGSFAGGLLVERSLELALGVAIGAMALGALAAWSLLPRGR